VSVHTDLAAVHEEIAAKGAVLSELLKGATDLSGTKATERVDAIRQANDELSDLGSKRDRLQDEVNVLSSAAQAAKASRMPTGRQVPPDEAGVSDDTQPDAIKSMRSLLRESTGYQDALKSGRRFRGEIGELSYDEMAFKTLSTTADMVGQTQRLPLVLSAQEDRTVADLMLPGTTNASAIEYYEETTFTNSAAEVSEGGAKPESAVDFTLRTDSVRKIATWIPVTDEMIADNDGFESYLRERLGFMVRRREEAELLAGDGTAPNISGILDRSGIQTQAKGADPTPDAVYKAMTKVRSIAFAEPTAAVFHPNDWQDIRLLRTADGIYIWGSPADAGPERIWGLTVRITTAMTENTALVGAFRPHAQIFRRTGISVAVSDSHDTYFIYNKLAVRAEERLALAVYRPAAFCSVTGI
jgi:HK97 family phage major capsid protein